jgi:hypothetical protein
VFFLNVLICSITKLYFLTFTLSHEKNILFFIKRFLEPVHPGVGSSGTAKTPQCPDISCHIVYRVLFTTPYSTPNLDRSHDTHRHESTQWSRYRGGDRDEAGDVVEIVSFSGAKHVTNTRTLPCTFLVDDNKLPLKPIRLPGSFSYFNYFMLSISYTNHLDHYF